MALTHTPITADVRLIIDPPRGGPWNMAVDETLLLDAVENDVATLRFYQWNEPTLSLGYFQRYADRAQHPASRGCAAVRRQTGGGAILHDRELTYSLALPAGHPLARLPACLYEAVHAAFIDALSIVQPAKSAPSELRIRGGETPPAAQDVPFLCFQRQSPGDVVFVPGGHPLGASSPPAPADHRPTWKVLGSAQRRHRGAILQHGSLLVGQSPAAPELPGLYDLNGLSPRISELIAAVCTKLAAGLGIQLTPSQLPRELQSRAADLANTKYGAPAWTNRR